MSPITVFAGTTTSTHELYKPAYGEAGATWWGNINSNFDKIDARIENAVYAKEYTTLNAAAAAAAVAFKPLVVDKEMVVSTAITVASTSPLVVTPQGRINHDTHAITINSVFSAGLHPVFIGTGSVTFGPGATDRIYPEWYGAERLGTGSGGDTSTAVNKAALSVWASRLNAAVTGQPNPVRKQLALSGWYRLDDTAIIKGNGIDIVGTGSYSSGFVNYSPSKSAVRLEYDTDYTESGGNNGFIGLRDFSVIGTATGATDGHGIELGGPFGELRMSNVDLSYHGGYGLFSDGSIPGAGSWVIDAVNCHFIANHKDGANTVSVAGGSYTGNASSYLNCLFFLNGGYGLNWLANGLNVNGVKFERNGLGSMRIGPPAGSNPISTWPGGVNINGSYFESTASQTGALQHIHIYAPPGYSIDGINIGDGNTFTGGHTLSPDPWRGMIYCSGGGTLKHFRLGMNQYAWMSVSTALDCNDMPDETSLIYAFTPASSMDNLLDDFDNTGDAMVIHNHTDNLSTKISANEDVYSVYPTSTAVRAYTLAQNTAQSGTMNFQTTGRYKGDLWIAATATADDIYISTRAWNYTDNNIVTNASVGSGTTALTLTSYGTWVKENDLVRVLLTDASYYYFIADAGATSTNVPVKTYISGSGTPSTAGFWFSRWQRMATGTAGSTDNAVCRANGTGGEIQGSMMTVDDSGNTNIPAGATYSIGGVPIGGMTNPMTTLGDTIYGGASGVATRLPGNTTTIKKFATQTGDGANSAAPAWGTIAASDIPDISATYIPKSLLTEQGDIIYASAASTPAALPHGAAGQVLQSGGHAANPSWLTLGTMAAETATNYVTKALFDANTILYATTDNTPVAATIAEQQVVGRLTGGAIKGLSTSELTGLVMAASDSMAGKVELATAAETTTGTDAARAVTPDGLAGSETFGAKVVQIQCVADATDVDTTSGICYWFVPRAMNGMNLVRAQAMVATAGTTNATTIQVRNLTKYSSNDALSSAISIASGGTVGTVGTVNTSYDDVATNDKIKVYVTAQSTTKPKGLWVVLEYMLP